MGPQLLRQAAAGVLSFKFAPRRPGHMKKVLVIVSILAAAAACGGGNTASSSTSSNGGTSLSQPASGGGQTSKAAGQRRSPSRGDARAADEGAEHQRHHRGAEPDRTDHGADRAAEGSDQVPG